MYKGFNIFAIAVIEYLLNDCIRTEELSVACRRRPEKFVNNPFDLWSHGEHPK